MKKLVIASGATAVALAAMPILGTFANVTDTVTLTIQGSCSVGQTSPTAGAGKTITESNAVNNQLYTYDADGSTGGTLKVACNDASGWNVKAVGSSSGADNTVMVPTASGTAIETGTATSGADSQWMFKVAGTNVLSPYNAWAEIPDTATKVASSGDAASNEAIDTGYQVWVSATQEADTYTGSVTYTVATGV